MKTQRQQDKTETNRHKNTIKMKQKNAKTMEQKSEIENTQVLDGLGRSKILNF